MEQYYFMAIFFLVGYVVGKLSVVKSLKKENEILKKESLILKTHIVTTNKGRIIVKGKEN